MCNINNLTYIPQTFKKDKLINQAFDVAEFLALPKEKQWAYQQDLKARLDYKNVMDYAKEMAKEEGLQEGIQEGKEQAKIEIAKSLLDILDDETICLKTSLSKETIKNLRAKN